MINVKIISFNQESLVAADFIKVLIVDFPFPYLL